MCVTILLFSMVVLLANVLPLPLLEAKVEQDEEEEVRRAKYFIRDEFLVCLYFLLMLSFI